MAATKSSTSNTDTPRFDVAVVGLGYVGLPLVREVCRAGLRVVGFDVSEEVVAGLCGGRSHVDDVSDEEVGVLLGRGLVVSSDPGVLVGVGVVVVCVPTPLDADGRPDLSAVCAAARWVGAGLAAWRDRGARAGGGVGGRPLVVLESTTYPGTTDEVVAPILEAESGLVAGVDFALAFSPERIDPGNAAFGLQNTPKVVGGYTPACAQAAEQFYGKFCDQVVRARGTREAEMAKLLENTYRHVNIALVNEMAIFCHELGIDLWDAIACAATKPFGFAPFWPGPGVGGHCIPIDPNYLSYRVRRLGYPFRFVELAQEINARMPAYIVSRITDLLNRHHTPLADAHILLLGVTYKPDIADTRETPATTIATMLHTKGATLTWHDPHTPHWTPAGHTFPRITNTQLPHALTTHHLTVLLQNHTHYTPQLLSRATLLFDTRGHTHPHPQPGIEVL